MNEQKLFKIRSETSPTFCLAKFHEASIWVYSGKIASCHYTPFLQVGNTVDTFYNPAEKREQQKRMLAGEQPPACNSCWHFENLGLTSDRTRKSLAFQDHLKAEEYFDPAHNFKPKALELAFQNTCNLACSYCSPQFSTSWLNDIRTKGVYTGIITDDRRHYQKDLNEIDEMIEPPDMNLFWQWFETVAPGLESIRVSGGEPLMHEEVFKLFDMMIEINPDVECVIHTNLCQKPLVMERFLEKAKKLTNLRVNVSNESSGAVAEFIREGMVYDEWLHNMELLCNSNVRVATVSTTCSAISLQALDKMYLDIIEMRKRTRVKPPITINMVDKPDFQGFGCLSRNDRDFYIKKYTEFYASIKDDLLPFEIEYTERLIKMLDSGLVKDNQEALRKDSDIFFEQYTKRRNKPVNFAQFIGKI
jgi:sulfatase maturation enzyme AslB (radical SAM superfamily)